MIGTVPGARRSLLHIFVQSVGMCTLPEMSSTKCFVLVGVVQNCSRSFALLVSGAALLYLTGHALPCSHLLYSARGTTTHVTDPTQNQASQMTSDAVAKWKHSVTPATLCCLDL